MKKKSLLIICTFILIFPSVSYAWGTTGHRVIAEIAERNLDKRTKKEIGKLLDNQCMAYWANWADFIKSDTTGRWDHTHIWHFVNAPSNLSRENYILTVKSIPQENLYSQIPYLEKILKDKAYNKDQKKEALIFLIHLIGDMHQPMHVGREEDLGGNKITVTWFGQQTNLHRLWDSTLIDYEKYSYTEYATVLNVVDNDKKREMQSGTMDDWFFDSYCIANQVYGLSKSGDELSYGYNYKVRAIVDEQLLKAGLRLAKYLNDLF